MTTQLPLAAQAHADAFEVRWDRWVAAGIRRDRILHNRAIGALLMVALTIAIVAAWLVVLQ